jgi:hypothetical protein
MAKAVRATKVTREPNGNVYVDVVYGDPPLGSVATSTEEFADDADVVRRVRELEDILGQRGLTLLLLAQAWVQPNGTLGSDGALLNKTLTLDPEAANPLKLQ